MVICITGSSTGIGAETARLLAEGNTIFIHYNTSMEAAERTAADVAARGGTAHLFQADLSKESGCKSLHAAVASKTDRLDVLVNSAGGLIQRQSARELEWALMERIFSLNVFSSMLMCRLSIPLLEKGANPCIVNVSSIAARHGAASATIYGGAKGAVDSFTRGLAKELAPAIRVVAVAPGVIETPFHEKVSTPERMRQFREATPLGRNGRALDVARAIRFLIESDFITGETIDVNGGLFMR